MKKSCKVLTALALAIIMAVISAIPAIPLLRPLTAIAQEPDVTGDGFISIRAIFEYEADDVVVTWNRAQRNIHIVIDSVAVVFTPGSNIAYVNNTAVEMQYPIRLDQGVAYIYVLDLLLVAEAIFMAYLTDDYFEFHLTEEARELVLYDFDFLISTIQENTPWESVINRRFDFVFQEYVDYIRYHIENMSSFHLNFTLEQYEEILGAPLYEVAFPIRDSDDPRYIAANYLSFLLRYGMRAMGGIGHLSPRELAMYRIQYSSLRMSYHRGYIDRATNPNSAMRHDTFTHPDVRWFYGEVEVDLYADFDDVLPEVPGNVITEIITPGEVAYIRINSFATSATYDDMVVAPFFAEIQDFDHLIIDIRGNRGGFVHNFTHLIMGRLIHEPVEILSYQFFSGGDLAVAAMTALYESTSYIIGNIEDNDIYQWYTIDIVPARQFISQQAMTDFNQSDLAHLDYVLVERDWIFPTGDDLTFDGKVWLLVDGGSASASSQAALLLMNTGLATVVGQNTSGVMAAHHFYLILPNTGMLFRIDVGYRTDAHGNSLEAHGITPDIRNFPGMNALDTVLEIIVNDDAAEWPNRITDADVQDWDFDIDFTDHPLTGIWAWDTDDSFIYELRADGTGIRGFYGNRINIYWYTFGNYLFIDVGLMVEHWAFTITDGVLTIVSEQVPGLTWSYIRQ